MVEAVNVLFVNIYPGNAVAATLQVQRKTKAQTAYTQYTNMLC